MSAVRVARAATRRDKIIKFAGCYHGHADPFLVAGRIGRDRRWACQPAPACRPPQPPTRSSPATTISSRSRSLFDGIRGRLLRCSSSRSPATWAWCLRLMAFCTGLREICDREGIAARLRRGDLRIPRRSRRRAAAVRYQAGPDLPGQDHRRRTARGRLRRPRGADGSGRAGGPCLSGGNAFGQPAGDDCRPLVSRRALATALQASGEARRTAGGRPRRRRARRGRRRCR